MTNRQKTNHALDEGCAYINEILEKRVLSENSVASFLLKEEFSKDEFSKLVQSLSQFADRVPPEMENTRLAVQKAVKNARFVFRALIRGKTSKRSFAIMTSKVAGLLSAIGNTVEVIKQNQELQQLQSRVTSESAFIKEEKSIGDILDKEGLRDLNIQIKKSFTPDDFLSRLFGKRNNWFGLTPKKLRGDILNLTGTGLEQFMDVVPDSLASALSDEDAEYVVDTAMGDEDGDEDEEVSTSSDTRTSDTQPESIKTLSRSEIEAALESKYGENKVPMGIVNAVLDVLKTKGIQVEQKVNDEEKIVLEQWRRMAGITGGLND